MSFDIDEFRVRPCNTSAGDLSTLEELTNSVFFDVGVSNWKIYLESSPNTVFLIEKRDTATAVGLVSYNMINEEFQWQHLGVLLPEFRQSRLFERVLNVLPPCKSCGGNRNQLMLNYYSSRHIRLTEKQLGFYGNVIGHNTESQEPHGISIRIFTRSNPVDSAMLSKILAYDGELYETFKAPRRSMFTKAWLKGRGFISAAVAVDVNETEQVRGYGVARTCLENATCRFTPVYADSSGIAASLLSALASATPPSMKLYIEFPARCLPTLRFCLDAGLQLCYCNVRIYENFEGSLPLEKMFAENEFWPL